MGMSSEPLQRRLYNTISPGVLEIPSQTTTPNTGSLVPYKSQNLNNHLRDTGGDQDKASEASSSASSPTLQKYTLDTEEDQINNLKNVQT